MNQLFERERGLGDKSIERSRSEWRGCLGSTVTRQRGGLLRKRRDFALTGHAAARRYVIIYGLCVLGALASRCLNKRETYTASERRGYSSPPGENVFLSIAPHLNTEQDENEEIRKVYKVIPHFNDSGKGGPIRKIFKGGVCIMGQKPALFFTPPNLIKLLVQQEDGANAPPPPHSSLAPSQPRLTHKFKMSRPYLLRRQIRLFH